MQSILASFPGCQSSFGIVPNGPAGLVVFFHYMPGVELLACSLDTDINYVTAMLQLRLSL